LFGRFHSLSLNYSDGQQQDVSNKTVISCTAVSNDSAADTITMG